MYIEEVDKVWYAKSLRTIRYSLSTHKIVGAYDQIFAW